MDEQAAMDVADDVLIAAHAAGDLLLVHDVLADVYTLDDLAVSGPRRSG